MQRPSVRKRQALQTSAVRPVRCPFQGLKSCRCRPWGPKLRTILPDGSYPAHRPRFHGSCESAGGRRRGRAGRHDPDAVSRPKGSRSTSYTTVVKVWNSGRTPPRRGRARHPVARYERLQGLREPPRCGGVDADPHADGEGRRIRRSRGARHRRRRLPPKPFSFVVLVARLRRLGRRTQVARRR